MKKQFFTFLMMIALVIVAGSAMAQVSPGTSLAPYANGITEYNYSWSGITGGDTYNFWVTTTEPTMAALPTTNQSTDDYELGTPTTGATSSIKIKWKESSTANEYYVSLVVKTTNSCSNFRYVKVVPIEPVKFVVLALGVDGASNGSNINLAAATSVVTSTVCPPALRDGADYDETDGTVNDGALYVFYRVDRVNGIEANDWTADLDVVSSITKITAKEYSIDGGATWDDIVTGTATVNDADNNSILVRVTISVPVGATANSLTAAIDPAATFETTTAGLDVLDFSTGDPGDNKVVFTVNNVPEMGGFSGN